MSSNTTNSSSHSISQMLRQNLEAHQENAGNETPTKLNMRTVHFPITPEQRQSISDETYRFRDPRRNSSLIDKKKRQLSQKDSTNMSTLSNNEKPREKTLDSIYDVSSNIDCNLIYKKKDN